LKKSIQAPTDPSVEREVVGRSAELDAIDGFLARLRGEPAAIVFEGRPGIGKTTVWQQVAVRAAGHPMIVLSCRPVEAETKLAFASLADLFEPVAEAIAPSLPDPQRLALDVALMRATPPGTPPSARAVATAVLSALRLLSAKSPVLIAIDDLQWLDRASAEALAFALRRIGDCRVGVAAALRVGDDAPSDPLSLDRTFVGRVDHVRLGPLTLGGLHHVIRAHLDHVFPRPTLRRIGEASDGNPFFALEIARALIDVRTQPRPGEPLPIPRTLMSLVVRRIERLPARARAALLAVSALSAATVTLVRQAANDDCDAALERAEQAGVIEIDGERIRFSHPLLASSVYSSASAQQRRALHRRLSEVVTEPEERARHLALAASEPDETVARALDDVAALAWRRGAPDTAGELQEQAARLTPEHDRRSGRRRRIQAAEHFSHAGDRPRARALLETVLAEEITGEERARTLHLLGQTRGHEDSFGAAVACLDEALAHAVDAATMTAIKIDLAWATFMAGDVRRSLSLSDDALADAERLGDSGLLADTLCLVVVGRFIDGVASDHANLTRALALEDRSRTGQLALRPSSLAGVMMAWDGRLSEAHQTLSEMRRWAGERGEEGGIPFLLFNISFVEWQRGDFAAAIATADEARIIAEQSGSETTIAGAFVLRGRAHAARGDIAAARADLARGRELLERTGYFQALPWLLSGEAFLALSLGDGDAAARAIEPLAALVETGLSGGLFADFATEAVEAFVRVGEHERAAALLDRFTARANALERPWAIATAARCRSLLALARNDLDAALAAAEEATGGEALLPMPVERGRAFLALGQIRRRRGERRMAREALERAQRLFDSVGASLWAQRVAEEIGRIPIRRSAGSDLTPTEERVAALAAEGRTNQEVAKALFMSPKTVEANLTRVYDKLGIRSRAELGARMLERRTNTLSKK
jgi:DNA-binding CsgD family transcriptional regulator